MDKICYKVARKDSLLDDFFLSTSSYLNSSYSLRYRIGKPTYPRIGKIFVFDTFENAEAFFYFSGSEVILKGMAKSISRPKYFSTNFCDIVKFWKNKYMKKSVSKFSHEVQKGTVWCDSFTPTEIVKPQYIELRDYALKKF